ncbi:MAG: DUF3325 family protein [Pseudomonadota bacterium]
MVALAMGLTQLASVALCLSMRRHRKLLGGRQLSRPAELGVRTLGFVLLLTAAVLFFEALDGIPATALLCGWFTITIIVMAAISTWVESRA